MMNPDDIVTKSKFSDLFGCARISLDRWINAGNLHELCFSKDGGLRLKPAWDALVANGRQPKKDPPWIANIDVDTEHPEKTFQPPDTGNLETELRAMLGSIGVDGKRIPIAADFGSKAYFEAMKEYWLALKTRQAYLQGEGLTIDRTENDRAWARAAQTIRQTVENIPDKWSGLFASITDEYEMTRELENLVDTILAAFQDQRRLIQLSPDENGSGDSEETAQ